MPAPLWSGCPLSASLGEESLEEPSQAWAELSRAKACGSVPPWYVNPWVLLAQPLTSLLVHGLLLEAGAFWPVEGDVFCLQHQLSRPQIKAE